MGFDQWLVSTGELKHDRGLCLPSVVLDRFPGLRLAGPAGLGRSQASKDAEIMVLGHEGDT